MRPIINFVLVFLYCSLIVPYGIANGASVPSTLSGKLDDALGVGARHVETPPPPKQLPSNTWAVREAQKTISSPKIQARPSRIDRGQMINDADNGIYGGGFHRATAPEPKINIPPRNAAKALETRGVKPAPGTRVRPEGVSDGWRIRPTRGKGGTEYFNPKKPNESVRVMQGNANSPYPNSQKPYARQRDSAGNYLDANGNRGANKSSDTHTPLDQFRFRE